MTVRLYDVVVLSVAALLIAGWQWARTQTAETRPAQDET